MLVNSMEKIKQTGKKEVFLMGKSLNGETESEVEEIELSLGLSLNGKFGVDPIQRVARSSSTSNFTPINDDGKLNTSLVSSVSYAPPLGRTCSLPVESEELRKRKEMSSLRRKEVKKKRMEKKSVGNGDEKDLVRINEKEKHDYYKGFRSTLGSQGSGSSQGSVGSQGSGSSGISDPVVIQGVTKTNEEKSRSTTKSPLEVLQEPNKQKMPAGTAEKEVKYGMGNQILPKAMLEMPCVSTREGPNGKKIDGFLYKFQKGEEVRIVCVCHGSFLTPAEFVMHGGGGNVTHPLRHIVINPNPLL